jgi:hypothetical protein
MIHDFNRIQLFNICLFPLLIIIVHHEWQFCTLSASIHYICVMHDMLRDQIDSCMDQRRIHIDIGMGTGLSAFVRQSHGYQPTTCWHDQLDV